MVIIRLVKNEMKYKNEKLRGIIYVRVSSDEQVKGTSLDDQEARCKKYCEDNNIEVASIFREEGASAKSAERKVLIEATEFCRTNKGKLDVFVVWKLDRFARNTEDHFGVRKVLLDYGVRLASVTKSISNDPTGKLMETMLAGFAEFDNSIRRQRCSNGMLARLKSGIWPWKPPVGYICAHNKKQGQKKTEPDQINAEVFTLIQSCLRAYSKGTYTQKNIWEELVKKGFEKLTGMKPTPQLVGQMLGKQLTFYAGFFENPWPEEEDGSDKYFKGLHKAMLTTSEWEAIKDLKSGKQTGITRSRDNPTFPLRGIVLCGTCEKKLTGSTSSGEYQKFDYYHCHNKLCAVKGKGIPKAEIESRFLELLGDIGPSEEFLKRFESDMLSHWNTKANELMKDGGVYEHQLRELQTKRTNIFEMRESGAYTTEQFKERIEEIDNRIVATKISLNETNIDRLELEIGVVQAKQSITNIAQQWLDLELPLRVKFQKLIFPNGISYDKKTGFRTPKLGHIYSLYTKKETNLSPFYDVVDPRRVELLTSGVQNRRSSQVSYGPK